MAELIPPSRRQRTARGLAVVLAVSGLAVALAGCGGGSASGTAAPASAPSTLAAPVKLKVAYLSQVHAKVLVDGAGYSLYVFLPDQHRSVTCTGTCALTWPPLTVAAGASPQVGHGVNARLVGTVTGPGGTHVVTYDGWPLYTYTSDIRPGMASGQGIDLNGGPWYLMRPDGTPLTPVGHVGQATPATP